MSAQNPSPFIFGTNGATALTSQAFANNFVQGYMSVTASSTSVTLTSASQQTIFISGSGNQAIILPVASTLQLGQTYLIAYVGSGGACFLFSSNASSQVGGSFGNNYALLVTCILTSGVTNASWVFTPVQLNGRALLVGYGGTGVNAAPTTPAPSSFAAWDANKNFPANNLLNGYTTTATAAGTTTLTVASTGQQFFTGTSTQTVILPVTSTLALGNQYAITNNSTQVVTVQSSGANAIVAQPPGTTYFYTCILTSGTTAASWYAAAHNSVGATNQTGGTVNYATLGNFSNGTTAGWSLGTVGTLTNGIPTGTPTFGSGAAGTLSISAVSSTQSNTGYALSLISSAATTAGNMLASTAGAMPIATKDQAKVLTWKAYYSVPTGVANCNFSGTSSNSFGVAFWDATNSVWLSSTANFGMTQSSGVGYVTGTIQTGATTANIQTVIYAANATAGAATINFTDFFLGPQTAPLGAVVTDWQSYTPTYVGFGTVTANEAWWRRVGDSIYLRGRFLAGTATAVTASVSFPSGLTYDSSKETLASAMYGQGTNGGTTTVYSVIAGSGVGTNIIQFGSYGNSASLAGALGTNIANGGTFSYETSTGIPITGWSSNVQMSSDTDTRVIAARYYNNASQGVGAPSNVSFNTQVFDTSASFNTSTNTYTVPVSGYYKVRFFGSSLGSAFSGSGQAHPVNLVQNGTQISGGPLALYTASGSGTTFETIEGECLVKCNAGDTLTLSATNNGIGYSLASGAYVEFQRLSGPSVIAATESVNFKVTAGTATLGVTANTNIAYGTVEFDSHGAVTSGTWKCPVSGTYHFDWDGYTNAATAFMLTKNGTQLTQSTTAGTGTSGKGSDNLRLLAGDVISIQCINTGSTTSNASYNHFSGFRSGN